MSVVYADAALTVHLGDCRDVLRSLPDESVHCVVTSPPYWGLRDGPAIDMPVPFADDGLWAVEAVG